MKILLAVDGSPYTHKMLAYISSNKTLFDPSHEYTVLTAQPGLPPRARGMLNKETVDSYYREESDKVLEPAQTFLSGHGLQAAARMEVGAPGPVIAQVAQDGGFGLVVMGSHGHGALGNLVMGSVATQVLAQCTVPVLLVR